MTDLFSDILDFAGARAVVTGGLRAGDEWALRFPPPRQLKFLTIPFGDAWLAMEGEQEWRPLVASDVLLFGPDRGFILASHPQVPPLDAAELFRGRNDEIVSLQGEGEVRLIGGHIALDPASGSMLSAYLPPLLHIDQTSPEAPMLRWLIDRLVQERVELGLASGIAATQIGQLLLVHVLRAFMATPGAMPVGALRAATHPQLSRALSLIHAQPGSDLPLAELARAAGMSRTVFAERFHAAAGIAPIAYVTRWRMLLAARALRKGGAAVGKLSRQLGYASESAFSQAFRRHMGASPRDFARRPD